MVSFYPDFNMGNSVLAKEEQNRDDVPAEFQDIECVFYTVLSLTDAYFGIPFNAKGFSTGKKFIEDVGHLFRI